MIEEEAVSDQHPTWQMQVRHYWEDGVKVRVGKYEPEYGYEYIGSDLILVITPLSQQANLFHTKNFCEGRGSSAFGVAGTGKTETIKDLAKLLGRKCLAVNVQDTCIFSSLFDSVTDTNCWVVIDEYNLISSD